MLKTQSVQWIVAQLGAIFDESVANLRESLTAYLERGELPDPKDRAQLVRDVLRNLRQQAAAQAA